MTTADAKPAHSLWVQLETRITTRDLHHRSGNAEAAAASVKLIFSFTRELMERNLEASAFNQVGCFLLNDLLAPYTSRWHGWMVDGRFANDLAEREFRFELRALQRQLRQFTALLELLKSPDKADQAQKQFEKLSSGRISADRVAGLGSPLNAGIGEEVSFRSGSIEATKGGNFASAREINKAEARDILQRRKRRIEGSHPPESKSGGEDAPGQNNDRLTDATALCLSGGGIRSATFCLGIVQTLARQGLFSEFDYLSTVSGGGYLGSFITSYLGSIKSVENGNGSITQIVRDTFAPDFGPESSAVRHLRNNSRYLLDGGLWGRLQIIGLLVTGVLTNLIIVCALPLLVALLSWCLMFLGFWKNPQDGPWNQASPSVLILFACVGVLTFFWLFLPLVRRFVRGQPPRSKGAKIRSWWEAACLASGSFTVVFGGLSIFPALFLSARHAWRWMTEIAPALHYIGSLPIVTAAGPVVLGLLTARLKAGVCKKIAAVLFLVSGPAFYFLIFLWAGEKVWFGTIWPWFLFITLAFIVWAWFFVDINDFSPHRYYRDRLCECYLAARSPSDPQSLIRRAVKKVVHGSADPGGVGVRTQVPLTEMNVSGIAPYHLLNAAANLPSSRDPNLRGRDCDFFLFSRHFCGGPVCGYVATEVLKTLDSHIDLGSAMAISGAAASSNMGVKTERQYRFWLTLLNVRLGYWLCNPALPPPGWLGAPGPGYLFREMTGWMHERTRYLNLSDGGHIENLAFYEALRRRCKFIVVVDGGMEPGMECADLMLAQRYAQIDLGARFNLDIADFELDPKRQSRAYAVFGRIEYKPRNSEDAGGRGWLLYLKLACTGGEPGYVFDYRRQHPDFPHQSTGEQIYDEAQFEAYRRLGEVAAESLFRGELAGKDVDPQEEDFRTPTFSTIKDWFQALANNLLPDNDVVFRKTHL